MHSIVHLDFIYLHTYFLFFKLLLATFCDSETIDGGSRGVFHWNKTEVNTTSSARCLHGPQDVVVTRTCVSHNKWTPAMIEICRTATTAQLDELKMVRSEFLLCSTLQFVDHFACPCT